MNRGQRFAFLAVAALIAVVAVFVLADSSEDDGDAEQGAAMTATATPQATEDGEAPTETPESTPERTPEPEAPLLTGGRVSELEYTQGDMVVFRVRSPKPEHVHVHGYDLLADVVPGKTTRMSFEADITGIFEIEFEDSGEQIAELRVEPR
jgi:hypothetical protein